MAIRLSQGCLQALAKQIYPNFIHSGILGSSWRVTQVACIGNYAPIKKFGEIEYPERRKLRFFDRSPQPTIPGGKFVKQPKRLMDMRGPELYHTFLLHKQYGIRAKTGGQMHWGHLEMARLTINRKMEEDRMFAVWRVDGPWKPLTKKGQGHRMGGGKGNIDKFMTPIKAGRVIVEMGGHCTYEEVFYILNQVAHNLPFPAEPISQEMLEKEAGDKKRVAEENLNPFNFEYALKHNFMGSRTWASPYDYLWHGKHR